MEASRRPASSRSGLSLLAGALTLAACAAAPGGPDGLDGDLVDISTEEIRSVGSPRWIYDGPLPALVDPHVVVSLRGHTLRVTGRLPATFTGAIPYWASVESDGSDRTLTVVYPIATGRSASLDSPGSFTRVTATPFRPNGMAYPTTGPAFVTWGGFPFMAYNGGVAFHGPITYTLDGTQNGERVYEWYLQRGPVSHGCNRMQGEHVVEMAQLIGVNMHNTWGAGVKTATRAHIVVTRDYDRLASGEAVDVEYPRTAGAVAPTGAVRVFRTWDGNEMTRVVCSDTRRSPALNQSVAPGFCAFMPANQRDLATGNPTAALAVDNDTPSFSATGPWANYTRSTVRVGANYAGLQIGTSGTATWQLPVSTSGSFEVFARYAPDVNRNTHAVYRVYASASNAVAGAPVIVNQRLPGSLGWVSLGTFTLGAGSHVSVSDREAAGPASDGWTLADAVRVVPTN